MGAGIVFLFLALLTFLIWFVFSNSVRQEELRREKLRGFAESNGLRFVADGGAETRWWTFKSRREIEVSPSYREVSALKNSGMWRNGMYGDVEGLPFEAFEHSYVVSTGKSSHTVYWSVFSMVCDVDTGNFEVVRMGLREFFKGLFGGKDVEAGHERFDREYWLHGVREEPLKAMFHEETCRLFLEQCSMPMYRVGDRFVFVKQGRLDPADVLWAREFFHAMWDEIPAGMKRYLAQSVVVPPVMPEIRLGH